MKYEFLGGGIGAALGIVGTATQTNEVLQTISLIITIIGAVISMIVVPLLSWYLKAKKDGKITAEEIKDGAETLKDGLDGVNDTIKQEKEKKDE